ncbi:MAG: ferredoxin family protein [Candidatus Odinarchaeota archaeon]
MNKQENKRETDLRDKLGTLSFETDASENAHITVDQEICAKCPHHLTLAGCPAGCFKFIENRMVFRYEDCIECGTCFLMCDQGSVKWSLPRGSFGVRYEQG